VSVLAIRSEAESIIYLFLVVVAAVSIVAHEAAHVLVSKCYRVETVFKAWDSGLLFGLFLSAFGIVLPAYGSTYIKQRDWRYEAGSRRMGIIYAVGPIASLLLGTLFLSQSMMPIDQVDYVGSQVKQGSTPCDVFAQRQESGLSGLM
jgi:TRAP-type C4-dicarboxylate transport system permease small subunit